MFKTLLKLVFSESKWNRYMFAYAAIPIVVVVVLVIVIFEVNLKISVREEVKGRLSDQAELINNQLQERLGEYRYDIRFLHATPPISGLVRANNNNGLDPKDNTTYQQWVHRLETIFVAFLENNQDYDQARVISVHGEELVRVDSMRNHIEVVGGDRLQSKKNRDYFAPSTQLAEGEMYMSQFSLNREFGKIQLPYHPTLRISLPVLSNSAERFGFLILNIHAEPILESLITIVEDQYQLVLTDNEGYFLVTPNKNERFSRDLAPQLKWQNTYLVQEEINEHFRQIVRKDDAKSVFYAFEKKINVAGNSEQGTVKIQLLAPMQGVNELMMERRKIVYAFLLAVTLVLLVVLAIFARSIRRTSQLAEARALSAAIIKGTNNAVISLTPDCHVTSWNQGAELLFDYRESYALGKSIIELSFFEDIDILQSIQSLTVDKPRLELQSAEVQKSNQKRYLSLSLSAIVGEGRTFIGVAMIVRDQTIERQAEEKIKQANVNLERKVAKRTAELEKASSVKNAFISNISHEMRTPLNGIMGTLGLIQKDPLSENQKRYLEMTEVSVNSLAVLINDILDLSKIEAGKLDLDFKPFNPIQLIESLSCSLAVKAQQKGLEFILDTTDLHCQSIVSDPHRFSQILTNIINNAIKFTHQGYIKVRVYSQPTDDDKFRLYCSVTDTGIGIAESNKNKLFHAFSQEDSSVAAKFGGTGLGLSICRQLTSLLHGEINFESTKGKGSTFTFYIEAPLDASQSTTPEKLLINKSCLMLTPSVELDVSLCAMLKSHGASCIEKTEYVAWLNGDSSMPAQSLELILIDFKSPYLSALDKHWQQLVQTHGVVPKVIVLHNSGEPIPLMQHLKPVSLHKPVLVSELLKKCLDTGSGPRDPSQLCKSDKKIDNHDSCQDDEKNKLKGANILIVDDNEINIEVASGMLSELPINIYRAMNGRQALDVLSDKVKEGIEYHCILMDCQMPILDGYQTSEQIRNGAAGETYRNIPIIAMTANAMLGERKKCIDAGMSDYITKPIYQETLMTTVTKWISSVYLATEDVQNKQIEVVKTETANSQNSQDVKIWDKDSALKRLMDNEDLLKQICRIFINKSPEKMALLVQYHDAMDFAQLGKASHSLKGSTGDIGATELHALFSQIEQQAKQQNAEETTKLMEQVQRSYTNFITLLNAYLG